MGHHGRNDEGSVRVPLPHHSEDRGEDGMASRGRGMGVSPHGGGPGGGGAVAHDGLRQEVSGLH